MKWNPAAHWRVVPSVTVIWEVLSNSPPSRCYQNPWCTSHSCWKECKERGSPFLYSFPSSTPSTRGFRSHLWFPVKHYPTRRYDDSSYGKCPVCSCDKKELHCLCMGGNNNRIAESGHHPKPATTPLCEIVIRHQATTAHDWKEITSPNWKKVWQ